MPVVSYLLAFVSGILLVLAFPPFDLHYIAWIALVPLFIALNGRGAVRGFIIGAVFGLSFFCGSVYWVMNSIHYYGGLPFFPSSLITLLLCAYLSLYPAMFSAIAIHARRMHPSLFFIAAPAVWVMLELARTYIFSGFPWALLGYSQYLVLPIIQIADITGVYGISFIIVFVNAAVSDVMIDRKRIAPPVAALAVAAAVVAYGMSRLDVPHLDGKIRISVVQGNIEQDRKWDPAYQAEVISTYRRLTLSALQDGPDLVIWPETAAPFYFGGAGPEHGRLTKDLEAFVKKTGVPLLFGSPTYEIRPGKVVRLRNSAFLLSGSGNVEAVYHKLHLVPFGEYVPLKGILFFVDKMVQAIGDFEPGSSHTVMTARTPSEKDVKIGAVICYEIIFPDLVRRFVDRGASVITTITNDAWFGRTNAPYQHFSMAVLRAVENRVPIARAANTGISGFISPYGRIQNASAIFTEAYLTDTLETGSEKTFYTRYGDLFAYACSIGVLSFLAFGKKVDIGPRIDT